MRADLTIKNYRCFRESNPARFQIADGLTAFIGVNNSGKSSLLRFFFEFRDLFRQIATGVANSNILAGSETNFNLNVGPQTGVYDIAELFSDDNSRDLSIDVTFTPSGPDAVTRALVLIARNTTRWRAQFFTSDDVEIDAGKLNEISNERLTHERKVYSTTYFRDACMDLANSLYVGPFRNVLNIGTNSAYFDIQTGQSFVQTWKNYKTGPSKAHNEATQRVTRDIQRIFDLRHFEINPYFDDTTLQLYIEGRSYKLPAVGSGLTQFILVLANAAASRPAFILLDEPELNLHPALQVDFLTTLASYAPHGVLFGTHSVGLARSVADRIYALQPSAQGSLVTEFDDTRASLSEMLGELSYAGYRALGFDKVLLVEGRTEVKTIQQFLRLYSLDHQVVLVPMGGRELINARAETELRELSRLSDNVHALIDSERQDADAPVSAERVAFVQACQNVGITCTVLQRRAIENYLSDQAVKKVVGKEARALAPFEALKDAPTPWSKRQNWRIAREMNRAEVEESDLGEFFRSIA